MGIRSPILLASSLVLAVLLYRWLDSPVPVPDIIYKDGWFGKGKKELEDNTTISEFRIRIPTDVLDDLDVRLDNTRFADQLEDTGFEYGFMSNYLKEVVGYWRNEYDWRKHEAILNRFPQFITQIEGIGVHFIWVKPPSGVIQGKKPLIITHGWPGSVWEFYKLIPRLTEPEKYGGSKEEALEVICPSIPGYGFSEKPHKKGFGPGAAARVFTKLMIRLGYEEFYVQGGDWGAVISTIMAQAYPKHVKAMHVNMPATSMFEPLMTIHQIAATLAPNLLLDEHDRNKIANLNMVGLLRESGYLHLQATRPDTVGSGLTDSPAGLAAYTLEKFSVWTNADYLNHKDGGLTKKFTMDELLTNVMIYWVTSTITSSQRFYKEFFGDEAIQSIDRVHVTVPTGVADFPHEIFAPPRALLRYKYRNLIHYAHMPDGGHFAAFEQPELLANDILSFIRIVKNLE